MIDVEIAVRILGNPNPIYLPGCLSVAELEKLLGRHITGFRRPAYHIDALLTSKKAEKELLVDEAGTRLATFYFKSDRAVLGPYFGAKRIYLLAQHTKKDVIVGHADILIE